MGRLHCCVPGCNSYQGKHKHLTWHFFPRDSGRCSHWVANIAEVSGKKLAVSSCTKICSLHFRSSDYRPLLHCRKRLLKQNAVPTVFTSDRDEKDDLNCLGMTKLQQEIPFSDNSPEELSQLTDDYDNISEDYAEEMPMPIVKLEPLDDDEDEELDEILPTIKNSPSEHSLEDNFSSENHSDHEGHRSENIVRYVNSAGPENCTSYSPKFSRTVRHKDKVTKCHNYLGGKIDLARLPPGWAPLLMTYDLQVLKVRKESVIMCLLVTGNRELLFKVLDQELPASHPVNIFVLKYRTVCDFDDLLDLLKKLDEWQVCSGIDDPQLVDFYYRNSGIDNCRAGPFWSCLYSTRCELMYPLERKTKVCKECETLNVRLRTKCSSVSNKD